jgi:hypothetical protein
MGNTGAGKYSSSVAEHLSSMWPGVQSPAPQKRKEREEERERERKRKRERERERKLFCMLLYIV